MTPDVHTWPLSDTFYSTQYIKSIYTYNVFSTWIHVYVYIRLVTNDCLVYTYQIINAVAIVLLGYLSKIHFRLFVSFPLPYFINEGNPVIGFAAG